MIEISTSGVIDEFKVETDELVDNTNREGQTIRLKRRELLT